MRKVKTESFVITRDHLERESLSPKEIADLKKEGYDHHFKLYDDDDILYYSGYFKSSISEEDIEAELEPLDWAEYDSGCTRIDYRNTTTGVYETL